MVRADLSIGPYGDRQATRAIRVCRAVGLLKWEIFAVSEGRFAAGPRMAQA